MRQNYDVRSAFEEACLLSDNQLWRQQIYQSGCTMSAAFVCREGTRQVIYTSNKSLYLYYDRSAHGCCFLVQKAPPN